MEQPSSSSSATKSRGYRRRSRPARTKARTEATNDGKHSSFRHRPKSSTPKASPSDESIVVPFPVPSILATKWLIRTAPVVLAQHLVYTRGMWPMSVPQLLLLEQQEKTNQESSNRDSIANHNRSERNAKETTKIKRQRLNHSSRANPSLRRKQQLATDQIHRLSDEWTKFAALASNLDDQNEDQCKHTKLPKFLLILLGSSYTRGRELYLLDFQSLIDGDESTNGSASNDNSTTCFTQEKEQKYKAMLARKLVSALMNYRSDDGRPSVANSLPAPTSPSFRLWFTAGFENRLARDDFANADEPLTSSSTGEAGYIPSAHDSTLSTVSWIPRAKFPLSKQKPQSRSSSRTQSLITIRFVRSQKLSRPKHQQPTHQDAIQRGSEEARDNHIATALNLLHSTLEQLTWMSLSTHVKGFRL